jgi:hypothetical protein
MIDRAIDIIDRVLEKDISTVALVFLAAIWYGKLGQDAGGEAGAGLRCARFRSARISTATPRANASGLLAGS